MFKGVPAMATKKSSMRILQEQVTGERGARPERQSGYIERKVVGVIILWLHNLLISGQDSPTGSRNHRPDKLDILKLTLQYLSIITG